MLDPEPAGIVGEVCEPSVELSCALEDAVVVAFFPKGGGAEGVVAAFFETEDDAPEVVFHGFCDVDDAVDVVGHGLECE